ncbi:MAG: ABC transporter ATP-binding protein [Suipraeoptans sp.]
MNAIELSDVHFGYATQKENGLHGVSLSVPKEQCLLLCGASGCGKTTITRLINGLIPNFFEGELVGNITVAGMNMKKSSMVALSEKVGSVFQNPRTQFFNTDPFSEVVFGMENAGLPVDDIMLRGEKTVEALSIRSLMEKSIFALSGGEKQKVAFASVYASEPEILVLDEPSSNLDPRSVEELAALIRLCKKQGKTIIIAEHRLYYLVDIADRVIYMKDGCIEQDISMQTFRGLSEPERITAGLRCRSLDDVISSPTAVANSSLEIELADISANYDKVRVLEHVNFSAKGGDIIAIIGHNGAGKSTLAQVICGLHKKHIGSVKRNGKVLSRRERCRRTYMVMQDVNHQLFSDSVEGECHLGLQKPDEAAVNESLSMLGLGGFENRHPLSLSGGQKQRLAVAVSILCEKDILVFDEPTSGLDLRSMKQVSKMMRMLAAQGKLVLVITHDLELISDVCSRVLYLEQGHVAADLAAANISQIRALLWSGEEKNIAYKELS